MKTDIRNLILILDSDEDQMTRGMGEPEFTPGYNNAGRQWEMLSEYQLMWLQCDGECCQEKLACWASTRPVARYHETD